MPLLALGRYTVRLDSPSAAQADTRFGFFSFLGLEWLLVLAGVARLVRHMRYVDRHLGASRYWALAPGLLGLAVFFLAGFLPDVGSLATMLGLFCGLPLLMPTATLLVWRFWNLTEPRAAAGAALGTAFVVVAVAFIYLDSWQMITGFAYGAVFGAPAAAIRLALGARPSARRTLGGLAAAALLAPAVFLLFGAPLFVLIIMAGFVFAAGLPFALLLLANNWARRVATGRFASLTPSHRAFAD